MRTAVYIRVSTNDQNADSQRDEIGNWVRAQGDSLDPNSLVWFEDQFSGRSMNRPGFTAMMEKVRTREVQRIVIWRLDRLGRTTKGLCVLFDELVELDVNLLSLREGFNLQSPAGRLHARILASVAEYETEIRRERVLAGQQAARARGKKIGGSKPGRIGKVTMSQGKLMHKLKREGMPNTEIGRMLGVDRRTVERWLRGDTLKGKALNEQLQSSSS